jgi:DNA repair exonuclease SbcCD ATPase subunit
MKRRNPNESLKSNKITSKQDNTKKEEKLMNEIVDLKNAVNINWKILNEYILSNLDNAKDSKENPEDEKDRQEIEELLNSCKSLIDNNINIDEKIQKLKEENQEITEMSQKFQYQAQKEYEEEKNKYIKLQMELTKKKSKLNDIENILNKTRAKSLYKEAKNEIYVIEPTRKHLEMHQEILSTTEAIKQLETLGKEDNIKLIQLKNELEELQNEFNNTKGPIVPPAIKPVSPGSSGGTPVVNKLKNGEVKEDLDLDEEEEEDE